MSQKCLNEPEPTCGIEYNVAQKRLFPGGYQTDTKNTKTTQMDSNAPKALEGYNIVICTSRCPWVEKNGF